MTKAMKEIIMWLEDDIEQINSDLLLVTNLLRKHRADLKLRRKINNVLGLIVQLKKGTLCRIRRYKNTGLK